MKLNRQHLNLRDEKARYIVIPSTSAEERPWKGAVCRILSLKAAMSSPRIAGAQRLSNGLSLRKKRRRAKLESQLPIYLTATPVRKEVVTLPHVRTGLRYGALMLIYECRSTSERTCG